MPVGRTMTLPDTVTVHESCGEYTATWTYEGDQITGTGSDRGDALSCLLSVMEDYVSQMQHDIDLLEQDDDVRAAINAAGAEA